jgi:hypothetical protein
MTEERYKQLNGPEDFSLSEQEIKEGWHFCHEFDGLCRNSNEEAFTCSCNEFQSLPEKAASKPKYPEDETFTDWWLPNDT